MNWLRKRFGEAIKVNYLLTRIINLTLVLLSPLISSIYSALIMELIKVTPWSGTGSRMLMGLVAVFFR